MEASPLFGRPRFHTEPANSAMPRQTNCTERKRLSSSSQFFETISGASRLSLGYSPEVVDHILLEGLASS